jgi:hypothetical protein
MPSDELISPEYREMQKTLHEAVEVYGVSSGKNTDFVQEFIDQHDAKSVLDYGCGKGLLKQKLGDIVREYDPGIPGKDGEPEPADVVVCMDVLEHIEPDKLDAVLDHIRSLARKAVYVKIATREALKTLPDGRNAHLIVETPEWWRERLSIYFDVKIWDSASDGTVCHGALVPYLTMGEVHGIGVMTDEERFEHCRVNVAVTDKRVKIIPAHDRVCILLCYGPSLEDTWQSAIQEFHVIGNADIVSVSGAHDYVIERGIVPKYHVECDPRKHKGDMVTLIDPRVEYLMASCCHPDVIAKFKDANLTLWHLDNGKATYRIGRELEPNAMLVGGGGSVGLRAINLLYMMGYRRFIIHGMDCSYRDDGTTHAGAHTGKKTQKIEVMCKGRRFVTAPVLLTYLKNFDGMRQHCGDPTVDPTKMEIILRGDGLLQHAVLTAGAGEAGQMPGEGMKHTEAA